MVLQQVEEIEVAARNEGMDYEMLIAVEHILVMEKRLKVAEGQFGKSQYQCNC